MPQSKGRILCTEDDPDSREILIRVLQAEGYEVVYLTDSTQALEFAKNESFDLILLDNWMAGLDGCTLTTEIRKFDQKTPILFYSGATQESDVQAAMDSGAQGYLMKPAGIEELTGEIARLMAQSKH